VFNHLFLRVTNKYLIFLILILNFVKITEHLISSQHSSCYNQTFIAQCFVDNNDSVKNFGAMHNILIYLRFSRGKLGILDEEIFVSEFTG